MRTWLGVLAALSLVVGATPVSAQETTAVGDPFVVPGLFVSVESSGLTTQADRMFGHAIVERPADTEVSALSTELGTEFVPMVMYQFADDPTAEPQFPEQWNLDNRGQTSGVPGADIGVVPVWDWTVGAGVTVAVVDSGIDPGHPELAGRLWSNQGEIPGNGRDDDGNGFVDDIRGWDFGADDNDPLDTAGHGTSVASVAAAAVNGIGMTGVAPGSRVMAIRVCDPFGCPASAVASGIVYAVDNGAAIVNLSLGAPGLDPLVTAAVEYAYGHDVLVIAAAGNAATELNETNPWTPASIDAPNLVAVASTDAFDVLGNSSNFGVDVVDVAAPGAQVLTAALGGEYEVRSGTSFSAPHVAGIAALMLTMDRTMNPTAAAELLRSTSEPIDALATATLSGGRVDAHAAVQLSRFRDIASSEFADDALWAAAAGITAGCGPQLFCTDGLVTRGQMAAFLNRAFGLPDATGDSFIDDDASEFEADIEALAAARITTGCAVDRFCPDQPVTRGQMAAFLVRALGLTPVATGNSFLDDDGSVFEPEIEAIAAAGITSGCNPPENSRFCPEGAVTRGQMVALLHRALD